jgi:tryptophan-rich sensory protein
MDNSLLVRWFIYYAALVLFFAVGAITTLGLSWYHALALPAWAPSDLAVALIWCVLFLLAALSAVELYPSASRAVRALYAGNALLILLWNYLFFGLHALGPALLAAVAVGLSALALFAAAWPISRRAAWLLAPYLLWMLYAIALTHLIYRLNS